MRLAALVIWMATVAPATAAATDPPPPDPQRLDADAAVARALARHPALLAAAHAAESASARVEQARTAWLPRVGVDAGYRYAGPVPELVVDTGITPPGAPEPIVIRREAGTEHNAHVTARAGWRAWDFGARDARTGAADAGVEAAAHERDERAADIAFAVRAAYLAVLLFDETSAVTERSLAIAREERSEAELRRSAGVGDDLAVASAASRVADLESRLVDARQGRARSLATLESLLGVPTGAALVLTETLSGQMAAAATDAAAATGEGHPTLERMGALARATERRRDAVERSAWPTVDLYGSLAYQYPHTFFETDAAGVVWAAGVTLSWDAFDGGLRGRQEDELAAREAEISALRDAAREEIDRQAVDARTRIESALGAAEAAERSREAAEVYLEAGRTAFAAGTATALDVRKAEEAVDRAHLAAVKARFDGALARAALKRARGQAL